MINVEDNLQAPEPSFSIEEIYAKLLAGSDESLQILQERIPLINTFDLIANITLYNHWHDKNCYKDARGDRMFIVSEIVSIIALQHKFVEESVVPAPQFSQLIKEIQDAGFNYFSQQSFILLHENRDSEETGVKNIAFQNMRSETAIRNPMIPEHHLEMSKELYRPLEQKLKSELGFNMDESVTLRQSIVNLLNEKLLLARKAAIIRGEAVAYEIFQFRKNGAVNPLGSFSKEELETYNKLSRKQIKILSQNIELTNFLYRLGTVFCFTASELAKSAGLIPKIVEEFLAMFSCGFTKENVNLPLMGTNTILKAKPIIKHKNKYIVSSVPLLTFAVEPVVENYIKTQPKIQNKFKDIKHEYLLSKAANVLGSFFGNNQLLQCNLYYQINDDNSQEYETDGLLIYKRSMLIIEAKGNRFSRAAKDGRVDRTETHLHEIVRNSYEQAIRTMKFIQNNPSVKFYKKDRSEFIISHYDFDDIYLISLTLEPMGNLTPLIKATNELGYFEKHIFPWIVSLNDLRIICDHLELPEYLLHYISKRELFLGEKMMNIFEEIDLLGYYLHNRLYLDYIINEAKTNNATHIYMDNETDAINDYYIKKLRYKDPNPTKQNINIPDALKELLSNLSISRNKESVKMIFWILNMSPSSMNRMGLNIAKVKKMFLKDNLKHDCSILFDSNNTKVGFTFVTASTKSELDAMLNPFCKYKLDMHNANVWFGIGNTIRIESNFSIESACVHYK